MHTQEIAVVALRNKLVVYVHQGMVWIEAWEPRVSGKICGRNDFRYYVKDICINEDR